ncbi:MAG: hypothetical protein WC792_05640 [Candidatus Micrarchaeia archaeon]|jgi:hypothetical protein
MSFRGFFVKRRGAGRRGFLFTLDALLALALLYSASLALFAYSQQPAFVQRPAAMQALARDFLVANSSGVRLDYNTFYGLTVYNVTMNASQIDDNSKIVAHAGIFLYDNSCCAGVTCGLQAGTNASCMAVQENFSRADAWVFFRRELA